MNNQNANVCTFVILNPSFCVCLSRLELSQWGVCSLWWWEFIGHRWLWGGRNAWHEHGWPRRTLPSACLMHFYIPPANTRPQILTHRHTRTNRRAGGQTELLGIHCLLYSALCLSPLERFLQFLRACVWLWLICVSARLWTCEIIVCVFESASVFWVRVSLLNVCEILWDWLSLPGFHYDLPII